MSISFFFWDKLGIKMYQSFSLDLRYFISYVIPHLRLEFSSLSFVCVLNSWVAFSSTICVQIGSAWIVETSFIAIINICSVFTCMLVLLISCFRMEKLSNFFYYPQLTWLIPYLLPLRENFQHFLSFITKISLSSISLILGISYRMFLRLYTERSLLFTLK